ncbi:MAG: hypothetical protein EOO47_16310 [Flavobacterium sp.]|nr:MAG: hypothetical protein EOO47_16310 [Flavobacterium sp.]
MAKKVLSIFLVWFLANVIVGCCPEPLTIFYKINDLKISNCRLKDVLIDNASVQQKEFRISINLNAESFVKKAPPLMVNAAYATRCEDNHVGLKTDIKAFTITCNKDILGVEAGKPIDLGKMNVYKVGFFDDQKNQRKTVNEWIGILNNGGFQLAFEWFIEFNQPINAEDFLKFTVKIKQEDGSELSAETNAVKID